MSECPNYNKQQKGRIYIAVIHYIGDEAGDNIIRALGKMKYFVKNVRDEYNMERDKWINIPKTEEAQRRIRDLITDKLIEEARKYKFDLKKFNWTPCQQCHSLYAALS
mgnify:CR=1 FL=1